MTSSGRPTGMYLLEPACTLHFWRRHEAAGLHATRCEDIWMDAWRRGLTATSQPTPAEPSKANRMSETTRDRLSNNDPRAMRPCDEFGPLALQPRCSEVDSFQAGPLGSWQINRSLNYSYSSPGTIANARNGRNQVYVPRVSTSPRASTRRPSCERGGLRYSHLR